MRAPVVVLTGAGLSTASGIPDFRSNNGIWSRFDPDEFHITRFLRDPARFWDRRVDLVRDMKILEAEPNPGHAALAYAARDGRIERILTQNIDGLHQKAGTPTERLVELHGNSALCVCTTCSEKEPSVAVLARHERGTAPRCRSCEGVLKPDVVLFGEPVTQLEHATNAVRAANTLIAVGTSLQVWPVAGLVDVALDRGADLVIANGEPTPYDGQADAVHRGELTDVVEALFPRTLV